MRPGSAPDLASATSCISNPSVASCEENSTGETAIEVAAEMIGTGNGSQTSRSVSIFNVIKSRLDLCSCVLFRTRLTKRGEDIAAEAETETGGGTGGETGDRQAGTGGAETEGIKTRNTQYTMFTSVNKNGIESRIFFDTCCA